MYKNCYKLVLTGWVSSYRPFNFKGVGGGGELVSGDKGSIVQINGIPFQACHLCY